MSDKSKLENNNTKLQNITNTIDNLPTYINTSDATATASDIITDKTAYVNGVKLVGNMSNIGLLNITPTTSVQNLPAGYISGGTVSAVTNTIDSNIVPENIKNGVNILGTVGNFEGGENLENVIAEQENIIADLQNIVNDKSGAWYKVPEGIAFQGSTATSISNLDFSNVTDMSFKFYKCENLRTLSDILYSPNMVSTKGMFGECMYLSNISNFDTSNVTNMFLMFSNCHSIVNVPNFNTSNVTDMGNMFSNCYSLTTVPNFNTSNVTSMSGMFSGCNNLMNVPDFNTNNVTNMTKTFEFCDNLSNTSVQNIINMCINSNVLSAYKNISNTNSSSPLYNTKFDSSYYSNRLEDLTNAGWSY